MTIYISCRNLLFACSKPVKELSKFIPDYLFCFWGFALHIKICYNFLKTIREFVFSHEEGIFLIYLVFWMIQEHLYLYWLLNVLIIVFKLCLISKTPSLVKFLKINESNILINIKGNNFSKVFNVKVYWWKNNKIIMIEIIAFQCNRKTNLVLIYETHSMLY